MKSTIILLVVVLVGVTGSLQTSPHYTVQDRLGVDKHASLPNIQELREAQEKGLVTCTICRQFLESALTWIEEGLTYEELVNRLTALCVSFGIFTERVCRGAIEVNADILIWIAETRNATGSPLTPSDMCGFALYPTCRLDGYEWTLDLDFMGPKPTPEVPQVPPEGSPTLKVLQFTDVHIDPYYTAGYNAMCDEPTCCRIDQGIPADPAAGAGYWGDYRSCDDPVYAFDNMVMEAAARHQDIAYVLFTGDIVEHAVWGTTQQYNTDMITYVNDAFRLHFPSVPVINIFGNHEAHPCNVFSDPRKIEIPANLTQDWIYELVAELWSPWLPPDTIPDILSGGMFSFEVQPGLVVIGINTMFCYSFNWWLMYDNVDPTGELIWLANKLLEVEAAGKKAHILAHHPSGNSDCMHMWSTQYRRIIDRFENTLVAQFHGHTHNDHFAVYYDLADISRATSVSFTAGSGTPYSEINPNYRVYVVDANPASYRVLDHETWYFNLTEANLAGSAVLPNWQLMYTFNDAYGTTAPFPSQMDDLVHRMVNDTVLQDKYWRYYEKLGDPALAEGCDAQCMERLICKTVTTVQGDTTKCDELYPPAQSLL